MLKRELNGDSEQKNEQCSNIITENINSLNDDCLIHVFEFLPIDDKLKIELVCTRWNRVGKMSWSKVHNLRISKYSCSFVRIHNDKDRNINFYSNVLRRCGSYVNDLFLTNSILGLREIIIEINKYCHNIKTLCFYDKNGNELFLNEDDLKLLLINDHLNLRNVYLQNLVIRGEFLENLPAAQLEELIITKCDFRFEEYFYAMLSKVSSLKKLVIQNGLIDHVRIFGALNESNCTSICKLCIYSLLDLRDYYDEEFIKKQKNLCEISIQRVNITREVIESLTKSTLEDIRYADCNYELISSLNKFPKLHTLILYFGNGDFKKLTAKYVKVIAEAIDVKFIRFSKNYCFVSSNKNNFFQILKSVKNVNILNKFSAGIEFNMDKLLNIIKPCKNLEILNIGGCNFTGLGVTYINKFSNLKNLNISLNDKVADEWLISIVKKLQKLEKLFVFHCPLITNKSIKQANEIKKKRKDLHKLEVFCYGTSVTKNYFQNYDLMILLNDTSTNLKI